MYPLDVIVTFLQLVYEHACPFLTLQLPAESHQPVDLVTYVKQFWGSRKKNKTTAQNLLTEADLVHELTACFEGLQERTVRTIKEDLLTIGALCRILVDSHGREIEKFVLTPLGLALWNRLDQGRLFNQQPISDRYLRDLLTRELLLEIVQMESTVWLTLRQRDLRAESTGPFTSELVCFGWYLLFNGAIAKEHALHLVRATNKKYLWDETLVRGLNVIARQLFHRDHLFKVPSIQDVLQRRSELVRGVGASFKWHGQPAATEETSTDEYCWWEVGDYLRDPSLLDLVIRKLVQRTLAASDLPGYQALEKKLKTLVDFFRHRIDNDLDHFEMENLFPGSNTSDFDFALKASFQRALSGASIDLPRKKRTRTGRRYNQGWSSDG